MCCFSGNSNPDEVGKQKDTRRYGGSNSSRTAKDPTNVPLNFPKKTYVALMGLRSPNCPNPNGTIPFITLTTVMVVEVKLAERGKGMCLGTPHRRVYREATDVPHVQPESSRFPIKTVPHPVDQSLHDTRTSKHHHQGRCAGTYLVACPRNK